MNNFYFSQFHEHILRSSRLQMLFKVAALKDSQYFELKRDSNRGVFLWILLIFPQQLFLEHLRWLLLRF